MVLQNVEGDEAVGVEVSFNKQDFLKCAGFNYYFFGSDTSPEQALKERLQIQKQKIKK